MRQRCASERRGSPSHAIYRGQAAVNHGAARMPTDTIITRPMRNAMKTATPTRSFVIAAAAWPASASGAASTKRGSRACPYPATYDTAS
jgi:hypothetical protein